LLEWIQKEYDSGRVSCISDQEMRDLIKALTPDLYAELTAAQKQAEG
ncbi:MAG: hypothetical protein H5T70_07795, partial [Chloroflexi bacterium]|nr:hypothetical protein [Chloroflexota bacterium]